MESVDSHQVKLNKVDYITKEDVMWILKNYGYLNPEQNIENYVVENASNKLIGFLGDYWRLKVVIANNNEEKRLSFFIKAVSRSNAAKAYMVKELKLFQKEIFFYTVIKSCMNLPDLKPWSPKLVTELDDAIVFEDLNALQYKMRNKFKRFDTAHTLQALHTLARFHASSIIFQENRSKKLQRHYRINDEYDHVLHEVGFKMSDPWCIQNMKGALASVRTFSEYNKNKELMAVIDSRWKKIWSSAMDLNKPSEHLNVICHRDLWNNNILFHYEKIGDDSQETDDCVFVDFQAVKYQAPASDVMQLLYCNLEPKFRESNMEKFLNYYHRELKSILCSYGVAIDDVLTIEQFLVSAEKQRLWGIITCACLMQQFWVDDDQMTEIFSDSVQFEEILTKDKTTFIIKFMEENQFYKENLMKLFNEIVERYCLHEQDCK